LAEVLSVVAAHTQQSLASVGVNSAKHLSTHSLFFLFLLLLLISLFPVVVIRSVKAQIYHTE
jgi:hypothetical protein